MRHGWRTCRVYWGSHGCDRPRGHKPPHACLTCSVFCNPLIDWTNGAMKNYRREHRIPESDVSALLHKSGECNCGAFAALGEREKLRSLFPAWFGERISPLEAKAQEMGLRCAVWGSGRDLLDQRAAEAAGALCSDCQLRFDVST